TRLAIAHILAGPSVHRVLVRSPDRFRVPKVGLEPTRPEGHRILSPARLPVPPLRPDGIVALGLTVLLPEGGFASLPGGTGCSPDAEREVGGAEQEADASAPFACAALGHP